MKPKLSVVVPCYKEAGKIGENVKRLNNYLRGNFDYRIILVNDGSPDNTLEELKMAARTKKYVEVVSYDNNRGKGYAVRTGALHSREKYPQNHVIFMDADLSTPPEMIDRIDFSDGRIHIGDRDHPESKLHPPQGFIRRVIMGNTYKTIVKAILGFDLRDTQCGFKHFPPQTTHIFEKQTDEGFSFDTELLYIAHRHGHEIKPIPITWENDAQSSVNIITDPPKMILGLIRTRINGWKGKYD